MLNIAMLAYQGASAGTVQLGGTLEERRVMLFGKYIDAAFQRRIKTEPYDRDKTIHWVGWLAAAFVRQGQTIFHLKSVQGNWLGLRTPRVVGLGVGLLVQDGTGLRSLSGIPASGPILDEKCYLCPGRFMRCTLRPIRSPNPTPREP